ncbi:E1A [Bat mastadenovirus WIV12]|uniref:E1A n=1 Tax=Bat mastadenovirus WIV12 TaxID=1788434 RepID=A0A1B0UHZ2_9ADEN|nr:E1A [Bat mastadenovirus WIV12]AMB43143.1 E1A [Bat mastadenovirus WIV12]
MCPFQSFTMKHFSLTSLDPVYSFVDHLFDFPPEGDETNGEMGHWQYPTLPDLVDLDLAPLNALDDFVDLGYDSDSDFNMDLPISAFLFCDEEDLTASGSETIDLHCYEDLSASSDLSMEVPMLECPDIPGVDCSVCNFYRSRGESMCSLCYMRSTYALIYSPVTPLPEDEQMEIISEADGVMECVTQDEPLDLSLKKN